MTGVEQVDFSVWQITFEGARALDRKDNIVLAPDDQGRRLKSAEILVERRVKRNVRAVVQEEIVGFPDFLAGPAVLDRWSSCRGSQAMYPGRR